jgi:phosphosulfolactate synthase
MNLTLPYLPERTESPRKNGLTMVMDKGLGIKQAEQFIEASSDYVDIVKLGFGTSIFSKNLANKVKIYKEAGFRVYLGGTLFEAFIVRNMFDDYIKFINKLNIDHVEVSDGSIEMKHDVKCEYIRKLSKEFTVLSEVGSKEEGIIIHPNMWISMMQKELEAGSWIYRKNGQAHSLLINKIISKVNPENILWEAPLKAQQVYFIKLFGANVNLGNIGYEDVVPMETLRCGLRGDTFFTFLPKKL